MLYFNLVFRRVFVCYVSQKFDRLSKFISWETRQGKRRCNLPTLWTFGTSKAGNASSWAASHLPHKFKEPFSKGERKGEVVYFSTNRCIVRSWKGLQLHTILGRVSHFYWVSIVLSSLQTTFTPKISVGVLTCKVFPFSFEHSEQARFFYSKISYLTGALTRKVYPFSFAHSEQARFCCSQSVKSTLRLTSVATDSQSSMRWHSFISKTVKFGQ